MLQRLPYGQGVDWWALGIMLYAMLTGELPFFDTNNMVLEHYIKYYAEDYPDSISKEAKLIMMRVSVINIKTEILKVL
jgi:protein kinase A/protein kinase X